LALEALNRLRNVLEFWVRALMHVLAAEVDLAQSIGILIMVSQVRDLHELPATYFEANLPLREIPLKSALFQPVIREKRREKCCA